MISQRTADTSLEGTSQLAFPGHRGVRAYLTVMTTTTERIGAKAREMVEELQRSRDEVRVQLHLAGMETKDAFRDLESRLTTFEARAHAIGDEPAHELEEAFGHLRAAFGKLRAQLRKD